MAEGTPYRTYLNCALAASQSSIRDFWAIAAHHEIATSVYSWNDRNHSGPIDAGNSRVFERKTHFRLLSRNRVNRVRYTWLSLHRRKFLKSRLSVHHRVHLITTEFKHLQWSSSDRRTGLLKHSRIGRSRQGSAEISPTSECGNFLGSF